MDLSLGSSPQGVPDNTLTPITQAQTGSVETAKLPLMQQPIKDQISQSLPGGVQVTIAYSASAQVPVLAKPADDTPKEEKKEAGETKTPMLQKPVSEESGKTEKKDEKKAAEQNDPSVTDPSIDSNQQEVDGDQKPQKDQEEGQSGGGQEGSDSGGESDSSGGSGNFSGGSQDNPSKGQSGKESLAVGEKAAVETTSGAETTTKTSPTTGKTQSPDIVGTTPAAMTTADDAIFIDPLAQATNITASGLFSPPVNPAQFFTNGGKLATELYQAIERQAASMPAGSEKVRFMDFLLNVQTALTEFQELLRALQSSDSKGAVDRSKAKLESTLAKIETQRKEQAEMNKKADEAAAKQKILGPLMAIFAFLFIILLSVILLLFATMMIITGPAGWMAMAMLICTMVDQFATMIGKKPFLMQKFIEAIITVTDKMVEAAHANENLTAAEMKDAKTVGKTVVISIVMALTVATNPLVFVLGGVGALVAFLQESHIVRDMQLMAGKSEMEASMAEMYATIAVTAVFVIAAFVGALVCPPAAMQSLASAVSSAFARAAKLAADILEGIRKVSDTLAKVVKTIMSFLKVALDPEVLVSLTSLGLQTTTSVITYKHESLLADIAIIQGRMDSEVELKEATIQILKKMIKQLLDGLQGIGDEIAQIGQLLKKTHSGVSDMTSSLFA